jgi:hypothetical protein
MQAFPPRMLTARPAESEHLSLQSTTPYNLVNSNKVCENSLNINKGKGGLIAFPFITLDPI